MIPFRNGRRDWAAACHAFDVLHRAPRVTARPSWLIALSIFAAAALVTVLALIAFSKQPPPACSDAYDPACATIYEGEG